MWFRISIWVKTMDCAWSLEAQTQWKCLTHVFWSTPAVLNNQTRTKSIMRRIKPPLTPLRLPWFDEDPAAKAVSSAAEIERDSEPRARANESAERQHSGGQMRRFKLITWTFENLWEFVDTGGKHLCLAFPLNLQTGKVCRETARRWSNEESERR